MLLTFFKIRSYGATAGSGSFVINVGGGGGSTDSEAMRIDSSGRMMVGTTSANGVDGVTLNNGGYIYGHKSGGVSGYFDRASSDGDIVEFRKDSSKVGSIGTFGSDIYIGNNDSGLRFEYAGLNAVTPFDVDSLVASDGVTDLGYSNSRFKDLHLSGAVHTGGQLKGSAASSTKLILNATSTQTELHTAGNGGLIFKGSGDNELARIDSSGNIGIGTSSPSSHLTLHGNMRFNTTNADGNEQRALFNVGGSADPFSITGYKADATTVGMVLNSGGVSYFNGGNVGIGTSSPSQKLHVDGIIASQNSAQGTGLLQLQGYGNTAYINHTGSSNLHFRMGSGFTTRMTLTNAGNLGVGTSSPSEKLEVAGNIKVGSGGIVNSDTFNNRANSANIIYRSSSTTIVGNNANALVVADAGNIGIGTTSPQGNLHVEGAAGASGGGIIYVTDADNGSTASDALHISKSGDTAFVYNRESSGDLQLGAGNTAGHVVIKSSGNVGIGTSSPSALLHLQSTGDTIARVTSADGNTALLDLGDVSDPDGGRIFYDSGSNLGFTTTSTERMRIDSSGRLMIGTTSPDGMLRIDNAGQTTQSLITLKDSGGTGTHSQIQFNNTNGLVGQITTAGSATTYATSSDARLKDVTGTARGLAVINELNPVAYNWKADGKADEGLIAQEVKELVPNAVVGSEADMYQMDYSKLVVHLVAGMQEQQAIIEDLQTQLNKLKR